MARHAEEMLSLIEMTLRQVTEQVAPLVVTVDARSYEEIFDVDNIVADVGAALTNQFGDQATRTGQMLDALGHRVVLALLLDLAEEQGNPQPLSPVD